MVSTSAKLLLPRPSTKTILMRQTPNGDAGGARQVRRLLSPPESEMTSMTDERKPKELLLNDPEDALLDDSNEKWHRAATSEMLGWSVCIRLNNNHALARSVITVSPANEAVDGETELICGCGPRRDIDVG
jgi:hypothetical protein